MNVDVEEGRFGKDSQVQELLLLLLIVPTFGIGVFHATLPLATCPAGILFVL